MDHVLEDDVADYLENLLRSSRSRRRRLSERRFELRSRARQADRTLREGREVLRHDVHDSIAHLPHRLGRKREPVVHVPLHFPPRLVQRAASFSSTNPSARSHDSASSASSSNQLFVEPKRKL